MTKFTFIAKDRTGQAKHGTIQADSLDDCAVKLRRNGLEPIKVEPESSSGPDWFGESSSPPVSTSASVNPPLRTLPPVKSNVVPLAISLAAMLLSLIALLWNLLHDPLGKGLQSYDLSSPEAAMSSLCKIEIDRNLKAFIELNALQVEKGMPEKLETLKIEKTVTYQDRTILFVSFKLDGKVKHECAGFVKNSRTGYWLPEYTSSYTVKESDPGLAQQMEDWEKQGK